VTEPVLRVDELVTYYGRIAALKGVSLEVLSAEIVAIIGANGAGKTTLLNTLSGLVTPRGGKVWLAGRQVTGLPAERLVRLGMSHVPERRQIFASMTVEDNLLLGAYSRLRREPRARIEQDMRDVLELFPLLAQRKRQLGGSLSGGEQQMLAIGRGLMASPSLMLLDEPSLGLAPMVAREIFALIGRLRERGTSILLVEQNARAALRVADRGYVLEVGALTLSSSATDLLDDSRVRAAYLGV
jgi:branched-chain amino acid transport system ATP-binding protein